MTQAALFDAPAAADRLTAWAPTQWPVAPDWQPLVSDFFAGPRGQALGRHLTQRLAAGAVIYPPQPLRALALTPLAQVRVVILGQDPYHGPGQAEGLAFSVAPGVRLPPSLRNIHKELARDLVSWSAPADGSLLAWARQGVPASHAGQGWEVLTDQIVRAVVQRAEPVVFMLWGAHAQKVAAAAGLSAQGSHHLVLSANHPSPLSARRPPVPFLGSGHFGQAQAFLRAQGLGELVL